MSHNIEVNDWVSFYRDSSIVIGAVRYLGRSVTGYDELHTDIGTVRVDSVLEVRKEPTND